MAKRFSFLMQRVAHDSGVYSFAALVFSHRGLSTTGCRRKKRRHSSPIGREPVQPASGVGVSQVGSGWAAPLGLFAGSTRVEVGPTVVGRSAVTFAMVPGGVGDSPMTRRRCGSRAFVAVEAVAIAAVGIVLFGLVLVSTADTRRQSRLDRDLANLRQIGAWTFVYASDYEGLYPTFSSAPNSVWPDIRATASGVAKVQAVGHAIDIIRRRTGRETFPIPAGWFPHLLYTHLVLVDYAQRALPDTTFVSVGDENRLNWLDDPINKHDRGFWQPLQNPQTGPVREEHWRWPYSASFQTPIAWYDKSEVGSRITRVASRNNFSVPSTSVLGGQSFADVAFPSQKVMVHDYGAWYFSRRPAFFAHETSRVSVLMGDGGASPRLTGDSNGGWFPNRPTISHSDTFLYQANLWEPPAVNSLGFDRLTDRYRWTRGGIRGRDFDGPEIDTGQK
jgi:hypothetical protein